jgi:hypothetical protein
MPDYEYGTAEGNQNQAFQALMGLFLYLEGDFTASGSSPVPLERQKLISFQADLSVIQPDHSFHEAQRVDLFVTRQWIRLLLWEYTARHFAMACSPEDQAFSLFLPVKIGRELLSLFSDVTEAAIKTHGHGMVSVLQIARPPVLY